MIGPTSSESLDWALYPVLCVFMILCLIKLFAYKSLTPISTMCLILVLNDLSNCALMFTQKIAFKLGWFFLLDFPGDIIYLYITFIFSFIPTYLFIVLSSFHILAVFFPFVYRQLSKRRVCEICCCVLIIQLAHAYMKVIGCNCIAIQKPSYKTVITDSAAEENYRIIPNTITIFTITFFIVTNIAFIWKYYKIKKPRLKKVHSVSGNLLVRVFEFAEKQVSLPSNQSSSHVIDSYIQRKLPLDARLIIAYIYITTAFLIRPFMAYFSFDMLLYVLATTFKFSKATIYVMIVLNK